MERLIWLPCFAFVSYLLVWYTVSYVVERRDSPTFTTFDTLPASELPTPAIVVSLGDAVDPLQVIRESKGAEGDENNIDPEGELLDKLGL